MPTPACSPAASGQQLTQVVWQRGGHGHRRLASGALRWLPKITRCGLVMPNGATWTQAEVERGCDPDRWAQGLQHHQLRHTCGYQVEWVSPRCLSAAQNPCPSLNPLLKGTAGTHGLPNIPGVGGPGTFASPSSASVVLGHWAHSCATKVHRLLRSRSKGDGLIAPMAGTSKGCRRP